MGSHHQLYKLKMLLCPVRMGVKCQVSSGTLKLHLREGQELGAQKQPKVHSRPMATEGVLEKSGLPKEADTLHWEWRKKRDHCKLLSCRHCKQLRTSPTWAPCVGANHRCCHPGIRSGHGCLFQAQAEHRPCQHRLGWAASKTSKPHWPDTEGRD